EDHSGADQLRGRVDDQLLIGAAQAQVREDLVDAAGALDARQLLPDEQAGRRLGDADVARPRREQEAGEVAALASLGAALPVDRGGPPLLVDDLEDEPRSARAVEAGEEVAGAGGRLPERHAAAED